MSSSETPQTPQKMNPRTIPDTPRKKPRRSRFTEKCIEISQKLIFEFRKKWGKLGRKHSPPKTNRSRKSNIRKSSIPKF